MKVETEGIKEVTIPGWFIWIAGGLFSLGLTLFLVLAVPWAIAVQEKISELNTNVATLSIKLNETQRLRNDLTDLRIRFQEHIANPNIHEAKIRVLESKISELERRLNVKGSSVRIP